MESKLNISEKSNYLGDIPLMICGPCSAESEEQVLATAKALSQISAITVFRAGLWKPRTRPDSFEGVGEIGLKWMKKVKEQTNLKLAVEVANPLHVEKCLEAGIDMLWLGARTVVNPFSVNEISEALKGTDIPIMVKNPVSPDLELWIGAIERLNKVGIDKLIAVHRGFFSNEKTPFRNAPIWEIPIELKNTFPEMPVICDPSHICGNTSLIQSVSQKALDLEMDGLMIECHISPKIALTDKQQQLKPIELKKLISELIIRKNTGELIHNTKLNDWREIIDRIDNELIEILSRRMNIVAEIGEYKKENEITILQLERWREILSSRLNYSTTYGLKKDFIIKLLKLIHKESLQIQNDIMNKK